MINKRMRMRGFTLIELTIAMAFMAMLLLAILYLTLYAGQLYTKGVTNKNLNQIGRDIFDGMRRDFIAADATRIQLPPAMGSGDETSGRVCTGTVTYIWNTAPLLNGTATKITNGGDPVVFQRVVDPGATLCTTDPSTGAYPTSIPVSASTTELLTSDTRDFAIYQMNVTPIETKQQQGIYRIDMMIGTNEPDTTQKDASSGAFQCKPPANSEANFEYCTVSEFQTIVRAGGSVQ